MSSASLTDGPNGQMLQMSLDPKQDTHFIVMHDLQAWVALNCIAELLELACKQDSGFNIRAHASALPPSIAPTMQQQIIPHKPYVDMLPWPSFRDRILDSLAVINEAELVQDMSAGELKIWGSTPWDPRGWEVGPVFAKKWWFLMDDDMVGTANFWRAQRGEAAFVVDRPHKGLT